MLQQVITPPGIRTLSDGSTVVSSPSGNVEFYSSDASVTITADNVNKRINLQSAGGGGDAFTIIQCDAGTSPTADSSTDTLTLTSSDSTIIVTGDSASDEIDFGVGSTVCLLAGRSGGQTLNGGTDSGDDLILDSTAHATKGRVIVDNGSRMDVGDAGTEASGVNVNGTTYATGLRVNDIGGSEPCQFMLHRHSLSLGSVIVGSRTNSDTSSHAAVTNGMDLVSLYGAGYTGTHYDLFAGITIGADATGTISATSSPGEIRFYTTADGSNALTERMSIDNAGNTIIQTGTLSVPGAGSNSQRFGSGTTCAADNTLVVGSGNTIPASADQGTYIGQDLVIAGTTNVQNVVVGYDGETKASVTRSTGIGYSVILQQNDAVAVGWSSQAYASAVGIGKNAKGYLYSIAIGQDSGGTSSYTIALGRAAQTTADRQIVVGHNTYYYTDMYLGGGVTAATARTFQLVPSGGSGTDTNGWSMDTGAGLGTGTGTSVYTINYAPAGASGASLNSYAPALRVLAGGGLVQNAFDAATADGDLWASSVSAYLDESGNNLVFKVKYADGSTVKTGTVAVA